MEELIYDEEYSCFYKSEFIGIATFTDDPSIGDCFLKMEVHKKRGLELIAIVPDWWMPRVELNVN